MFASRASLALIQITLGKPDEALRLSNEALSRARQLNLADVLALAIQWAGSVRLYRREPEAAHELAEALIALAKEHGFQELPLAGRALRGWAMTKLGQTEEGVAKLEAAAAYSPQSAAPVQSILAEVYARVGRTDEALAIVDEELARVERSGARLEEARLYRVKGEAILMHDSSTTDDAEKRFSKGYRNRERH